MALIMKKKGVTKDKNYPQFKTGTMILYTTPVAGLLMVGLAIALYLISPISLGELLGIMLTLATIDFLRSRTDPLARGNTPDKQREDMTGTPRFAYCLLKYLLPKKDQPDILGDLEEEFWYTYHQSGHKTAIWQYRWQVLVTLWSYLWKTGKKFA